MKKTIEVKWEQRQGCQALVANNGYILGTVHRITDRDYFAHLMDFNGTRKFLNNHAETEVRAQDWIEENVGVENI